MQKRIIILFLIGGIVSCSETNLAPVTDISELPLFSTAHEKNLSTHIHMHETNLPIKSWYWPAQGSIIKTYSNFNKGLNISNQVGSPIYATAGGLVVYSGNGLRGYGNLIIIKHTNAYLSAYANNSVVLVKEGQHVKAGQKIAKMGSMLHFEIRYNGQPVNPLKYLN